jgi:hypothetical protein
MTDEELRALVREAIDRHLGGAAGPAVTGRTPSAAPGPAHAAYHPSHGRFVLAASGDGACIIEPAVTCTHCGYCKSYGH